MNDINTIFFELIRVAIGTQESLSRLPSAREWGELYKMAQKQSLLGVCFAGLQRLGADADEGYARIGINEMLYLTWLGLAAKIQQKNEAVNRQCAKLQKQLSNDGLSSCVLKGQGIAVLYDGLSGLRQSGDIDIWIDGGWEKVMDYVNARTPNREFDMKHTHYEAFEDTVVETHWRPSVGSDPLVNRKLTAYFEREKERQFGNKVKLGGGLEMCAPTADFQLVHAMLHVYGHFLYEGVGMRQMMDLYFAQKTLSNSPLKGEDVKKTLKSLGMMRFVAATQYVMQEVFGMSKEELLCESDIKCGKELLNEIMIGGNFGHHNEENKVKGETFAQRMKRHLKRRIRLIRFNPMGMLFAPFGKVRVLLWKRMVIKKYNL